MYRARGALFRTIDTVVDEKPLSLATSRMVTVALFISNFSRFDRVVPGLNSCCCWRTLQQRVESVSSSTMRVLRIFLLLAFCQGGSTRAMQQGQTQKAHSAPSAQSADPQQLFQQGEVALKGGKLDEAEHAFRAVLAIDPQVAGAYANLGVIYMRRKQWQHALELLRKAEDLAPQMAGVRLNIGLAYYRQNDFRKAIPPFES